MTDPHQHPLGFLLISTVARRIAKRDNGESYEGYESPAAEAAIDYMTAVFNALKDASYSIVCDADIEADRAATLLRDLVAAVDAGSLEMNSPEIGEPEIGIPYHAWHDEWLHHARALIESLADTPRREARPATPQKPDTLRRG